MATTEELIIRKKKVEGELATLRATVTSLSRDRRKASEALEAAGYEIDDDTDLVALADEVLTDVEGRAARLIKAAEKLQRIVSGLED